MNTVIQVWFQLEIFPITDWISVQANFRLCVNTLRRFTHMKLETEPCCGNMCLCVCLCVCLREEERKPGIISDRNGLMGRRCMRSWPRETHSPPASERMSCIFRCSYKFTPLPLCPLSCLDCLRGLTGHSGHALVQQLPRIEKEKKKERKVLSCNRNGNKCRTIITVQEVCNEGQRFRLAPFLKVVIIMFRDMFMLSSGAVFKFNHRVIW